MKIYVLKRNKILAIDNVSSNKIVLINGIIIVEITYKSLLLAKLKL